ncbi:MAG: sigma-54-dependent Fis family transcriptional regulator [Gammaproteobacteria bacterium]|nr:sigma-54-dependent Fis family transcriptional regulator [Gammaproteobacteria bacterium]
MNTSANKNPPVVLVDDEEELLFTSSVLLRNHGIGPVTSIQDSRKLVGYLEENGASLVLLDLIMPNLTGLELLPEIQRRFPGIPVVIMTAVHELDTAVTCMKQGAFDYLVKPVEENRFISCIQRGMERQGMQREIQKLKHHLLSDQLEHGDAFSRIITHNGKMKALFKYMDAVADSEEPVLVMGETGVGKELLVEAIHTASGRTGQLVAVNVAGIDDSMFADTLFGHQKGAYSGADSPREGMIAQAAGGTLFLDEIGDLDKRSQVKLLRLLQERRYYPLGSDIHKKTDARIVCATHRNLHQAMRDESFRSDLYYRLSAHQVSAPPLRERKDDIPLLFNHFLAEGAETRGCSVPTPSSELYNLLQSYHFPGNIRELKAMVTDALAQHSSGMLSNEVFKAHILRHSSDYPTEANRNDGDTNSFREFGDPLPTIQNATEMLIDEAMRRANNNQGIAAALLGITRQTLNRRLQSKKRLV